MPKRVRYYEISYDYMRDGPVEWEFVNKDTVNAVPKLFGWISADLPDGYLEMPKGLWRLPVPELAETPRFLLISKKHGRPPRDLETTNGVFIVSPATKAALEAVDPDACEFVRCETVLPSGEPGRQSWLCFITRAFAGVVDAQASVNLQSYSWAPNGFPMYGPEPGGDMNLRLIQEINAPLFHIAEMSLSYHFCNQDVKDGCKAAGLTGVRFRRISW